MKDVSLMQPELILIIFSRIVVPNEIQHFQEIRMYLSRLAMDNIHNTKDLCNKNEKCVNILLMVEPFYIVFKEALRKFIILVATLSFIYNY